MNDVHGSYFIFGFGIRNSYLRNMCDSEFGEFQSSEQIHYEISKSHPRPKIDTSMGECLLVTSLASSPHVKWIKRNSNVKGNAFQRGLSIACKANKNDKREVVQNLSSIFNSDLLQNWRSISLYLFGTGFILGPLLDAIHSQAELQVYDKFAVDVGGIHTNLWVFPILGTFYSVVGMLHLVLDSAFTPKHGLPVTSTFKKVAVTLICLVLFLELSAELYKADVPYTIEFYILFITALFNWFLFDSTWWGFVVASLVGIFCPLAEIPIIKLFGLWHYSKPDIIFFDKGLVTWVFCCYFAYTPFLANLSRWLKANLKTSD